MRGDEERVVAAFCAWLEQHGWTVQREVGFIDVSAQRGDERIYAEVKGRTSEPGLDVDTMFGQLLRRMTDATARYAVVVPEGRALTAVLRVPASVLERLGIDVYAVTDDGAVSRVG
ncbi:hypothetical protein [Kribbella sp. NPDC004536]|uniref:hypothetical protein n=1 Tax=Kribbella sp. NPDC004536 TaxID=3364106 RepID=UPI0036B4CD0E